MYSLFATSPDPSPLFPSALRRFAPPRLAGPSIFPPPKKKLGLTPLINSNLILPGLVTAHRRVCYRVLCHTSASDRTTSWLIVCAPSTINFYF